MFSIIHIMLFQENYVALNNNNINNNNNNYNKQLKLCNKLKRDK